MSHGGTVAVITVEGDEVIRKRLDGIPDKLQRRYLRSGMTQVGRFAGRQAKHRATVTSGTLKRSIGHRVYRRGDSVGVVVGPRRDMGRWVVRETIGKRKRRMRTRAVGRKEDWSKLRTRRQWADPLKYGHLVENDFRHVRSGRTIKGRPFMAPSVNRNQGIIQAIIRGKVKQCVDKAGK